MAQLRVATAIAAALAGVTVSSLAGAASAAPNDWEPFHFEGAETVHDFCDVTGLTVESSWVVDGRFRIEARGPDGVPEYSDFSLERDTWTNVATGEVVTNMAPGRAMEKATDNGDGTLTVVVKNVGNVSFYDGDGQRIGHVAGHLYGFAVLFDDAGTPSDPSDDVLLEFTNLGGKLPPAFCPILLSAIG